MSISGIAGIGASGFTPYVAPQVGTTDTTSLSTGTSDVTGTGKAFGSMVLDGLDKLERVQDTSDQLAVKAATGDLNAIHDYTIAATEANVTTQLTVAVRNKAVDAFNEIMRMQV
ncbi:flagellar hook-basal body complex protein FliE [Nocardioides pocheonensis]|uniref:Flagellar hook-basal body complex protein FliE n=1 Tax=Nocardioides pocheonensis TaxID=661485 RepID=A0A3N0GLW1_9ACTN|nr:flagellar hook-basal body complex protein FliE [Nocardioides pocheonensis]RNM13128.1 flagellar hook-basal body complex protein FliE [Nocardioides pocheonensis]